MTKRIAALSLFALMFVSTGCVLFGGPLYRSYRRLQGEWTMDETWTAERVETHVKQTWGSPSRSQRAQAEYKALMEKSRQVSFVFNRRYLTVRNGDKETIQRWSVLSYDASEDTALIRKWGLDRMEEALNRNLSLQELVDVMGTTDGEVPHVLGVRFLDNGRVEFFTIKVVMGKVTDFKESKSLQVYKRGPIPLPTATPAPNPTATPILPRPTPVVSGPKPTATPIPRMVVPAQIPVMVLPTATPAPIPQPTAGANMLAEPVPAPRVLPMKAVEPTVTPEPPSFLNRPVGR